MRRERYGVMVHIPRTGGGSIRVTVGGEPWCQDMTFHVKVWLKENRFDPHASLTILGHDPASELVRLGAVSQQWLDDAFKFAFVRNPWDRIVSLFFYLRKFRLRKSSRNRGPNPLLRNFGTFVRAITDPNCSWLRRPPGSRSLYYAQPQKNWLEGLDFVGRFEQLQDDWNMVCDELSLDHYQLPVHNPSEHEHYRNYYTAELRELVARRFAYTIREFQYRF